MSNEDITCGSWQIVYDTEVLVQRLPFLESLAFHGN